MSVVTKPKCCSSEKSFDATEEIVSFSHLVLYGNQIVTVPDPFLKNSDSGI